jgi:hypothetical protein
MSKIIVVAGYQPTLTTKTLIVGRVGYDVLPALSLTQLQTQLENSGCELVILGHDLRHEEKLRALEEIHRYGLKCPVIEVFEKFPELKNTDEHVNRHDGPDALLSAVARFVPPCSSGY